MRSRSRPFLVAGLAIIAACSGEPQRCVPPPGCVRADDACRCVEWKIVSSEAVPIRYLLVAIGYAPLGNESQAAYGYDPSANPPAASDMGSRWRSIIRAADGSEKVATVMPGDGAGIVQVTPATVALADLACRLGGLPDFVDVPSIESDTFFLWVNPGAVVETDAAGGKFIRWSSSSRCIDGSRCPLEPAVVPLAAGWLDGTVPLPNIPYFRNPVNALTPADRAAILANDPRFNPPGRDPATVAADARLRSAGLVRMTAGASGSPSPVALEWTPCAAPLSDENFTAFGQLEIAFGQGDTLIVQQTLLAASAACTVQQPSLRVGTSTADCAIDANVLIDTMFGTVLMVPTLVTPSCTTGIGPIARAPLVFPEIQK